jgi:hypothetical protein
MRRLKRLFGVGVLVLGGIAGGTLIPQLHAQVVQRVPPASPAPVMEVNLLHATFERLVDEVQGIRLALEDKCAPQVGPAR